MPEGPAPLAVVPVPMTDAVGTACANICAVGRKHASAIAQAATKGRHARGRGKGELRGTTDNRLWNCRVEGNELWLYGLGLESRSSRVLGKVA